MRAYLKDAVVVVGWTALFLAAIDVVVNIAFAYPADPRNTSPSSMQLYFEYGRSAEGKLRRMIHESDDKTAPIALVGWLDPASLDRRPSRPAPGSDLLVAVYGMSFAQDLAT